MNMPGTDAPVIVQRVLPVTPDQAFDAWLEPAELRDWMGPLTDVEVDARVGGRFRIVMGRDDADGGPIEHTGEYRELDRPNRIVFTWVRTTQTVRASGPWPCRPTRPVRGSS